MARIGIRREDKNEWERRVPLTPDHVAELVENQGIDVSVQPSSVRAFADRDYRAAGARLDEALDDCRVVFGVKEIPIASLAPARTYLYFSHTTKGQAHNMPMLAHLRDVDATLLDYENICDERGRRLVFFGRHAGYAGMIDTLWALGRRLAAEGLPNPFERVRLAHDYSSLDEATHHVSRIGERLRHEGVPEAVRPLVFAFTGSGNVSLGAREIFDRLPHVEIAPEDLPTLGAQPERPRNVLYKVAFERHHRFVRSDGGPFDVGELERNPERYRSGIEPCLEHLTVLVHGAFWSPSQPRLVSRHALSRLWSGSRVPSLRVIADIACDIGGGIEATVKATSPGAPTFVFEPRTGSVRDGLVGDGPVVLAVDNLPCQLPVESSDHFGDTLLRFVPGLARCDWRQPLERLALPGEIRRAILVHRGELTPGFRYLEKLL